MNNKFYVVQKSKKTGIISYYKSSLLSNGIFHIYFGQDCFVLDKKDATKMDDETYCFPDWVDETEDAFYWKEPTS